MQSLVISPPEHAPEDWRILAPAAHGTQTNLFVGRHALRVTLAIRGRIPRVGELFDVSRDLRARAVESEECAAAGQTDSPDIAGLNGQRVRGMTLRNYREELVVFVPVSRARFSCTRVPLRVPNMASFPS